MRGVILFLVMIITNAAHARWASIEDAPLKIESKYDVLVHEDGTFETTTELTAEILKESGRDYAANYKIFYNEDSTLLDIIEAKTIFNGKEFKVEKTLMQDKPLASSHQGFDQIRQVLIAFPKAEIGAKIYIKYKQKVNKVPLENFFANLFSFGDGDYFSKASVTVNSKIPLHIKVNDPEKLLKITKDENDNFHHLEIVLTKPIYRDVVNESGDAIINPKKLTWVSVSSLENWEDLAKKFAVKSYTKLYHQALPKDFQAIADLAAKQQNEIDQINMVTSMLGDKIQYFGDWSSVEGAYTPRDLEVISQTQTGDCKDYTASAIAILTSLGFKASPVFVMRGTGNYYPETLPDSGASNHAMVKVTGKQGKIYFVDPTNLQSMADGIFPDIAGKMALILDANEPGYKKIPTIDPAHAGVILKREIDIMGENKIFEKGRLTLKGEESLSLTGAMMNASMQSIKDMIFLGLSGSLLDGDNKKQMILPDLKSRISKDITIDYSFEQNNAAFKTNLGQALKFTYKALEPFTQTSLDGVSDILVGPPTTITRNTIIKNVEVKNINSLNMEINSPWLYVLRSCDLKGKDLEINDVIVIYTQLISAEELRTTEFIALKDKLEKNFKDVLIIFNKKDHL